MERMTLGVIIGNRDFFPDVLVGEARRDLLRMFGELGIDPVLLDEQATKLGVVLKDWMDANDLDASAIQCWSSMQQNFGVNVCTVMSMMSERLMPSVAVTRSAARSPSATTSVSTASHSASPKTTQFIRSQTNSGAILWTSSPSAVW